MELRWIASFSSSCVHAAEAVTRGAKLVDPRVADFVEGPAARLGDEIRTAGLPEARFWRNLTAHAHHYENNRELAATAIRKTSGAIAEQDEIAACLARRIAELESAMQSAVPKLVDELTHRSRPIRELWEAYGPGLLNAIGRFTDDRLIVPNAEVVLVHPVTGGGGAAHLQNNSVRLEAVLTNNIPRLPEVIRLGWLLSQLNIDLPMFGEEFHPDQLPLIASLAMLPPTLQSGQDLELCAYDPETLALAVTSWLGPSAPIGSAETLNIWWETYLSGQLPWPSALHALEKMLNQE